MKNTRNITPVVSEPAKKRFTPIPRGSLVSDRLGAQGFTTPTEDRNAELPLGSTLDVTRAEQELGAPARDPGHGESSFGRN
jgi:hypothetical protein